MRTATPPASARTARRPHRAGRKVPGRRRRTAATPVRAVAVNHLLLDRVEPAEARNPLGADDLATGHQAERNEARVDGAVAGTALRIEVEDDH